MELLRTQMQVGRPATDLTLAVMAEMIRNAATTERMRYQAIDLVRSYWASTPASYVRAIREFVVSNVTLIHEPDEILICPSRMLDDIEAGRAAGDCDDVVLLGASLLTGLGILARIKAVFPAPEGHHQHVFIEYKLDGDIWRPLDLTIKGIPVYPADFVIMDI